MENVHHVHITSFSAHDSHQQSPILQSKYGLRDPNMSLIIGWHHCYSIPVASRLWDDFQSSPPPGTHVLGKIPPFWHRQDLWLTSNQQKVAKVISIIRLQGNVSSILLGDSTVFLVYVLWWSQLPYWRVSQQGTGCQQSAKNWSPLSNHP